ncbi:small, acid-soluble spore protein L [Ectobacillus antri]|uniref:Small, acid-soluble spore protein L n=1 Tax=Ectobacillus antri TaxID=2486280 RepID=A0ABT6H013_9BACI|nr:small, acid-soluble spore protein L [Ectobacillus antri]MDG4655996.1 small, acid-soluble spore protein L [Ectobacillus antri]MDG5752671.1 small, acid-soluble spore protein L [Ectobacillus antri]
MAKGNNQSNRGKAASSVNSQGMTPGEGNYSPKSKLENRAKKSNTKI